MRHASAIGVGPILIYMLVFDHHSKSFRNSVAHKGSPIINLDPVVRVQRCSRRLKSGAVHAGARGDLASAVALAGTGFDKSIVVAKNV